MTHRQVHKEIGLWFYFAHGCSDIFWRMGRTLLARNKQDLFLKLAGGERDPKRAAALVQKLAPAYASEALNRSRHSRHWYVREYFSKAASNLMMRREELPLAWLLRDMARGLTLRCVRERSVTAVRWSVRDAIPCIRPSFGRLTRHCRCVRVGTAEEIVFGSINSRKACA